LFPMCPLCTLLVSVLCLPHHKSTECCRCSQTRFSLAGSAHYNISFIPLGAISGCPLYSGSRTNQPLSGCHCHPACLPVGRGAVTTTFYFSTPKKVQYFNSHTSNQFILLNSILEKSQLLISLPISLFQNESSYMCSPPGKYTLP
jgi:hypothetical protein